MPFVIVHGIPLETSEFVKNNLRRVIVEQVSESMSDGGLNVPSSWVRPFFVPDILSQPVEIADGASTIYVRLETAMFNDPQKGIIAEKVVAVLAQAVWDAFDGKYEVEVFISQLEPKWKKLIEARP